MFMQFLHLFILDCYLASPCWSGSHWSQWEVVQEKPEREEGTQGFACHCEKYDLNQAWADSSNVVSLKSFLVSWKDEETFMANRENLRWQKLASGNYFPTEPRLIALTLKVTFYLLFYITQFKQCGCSYQNTSFSSSKRIKWFYFYI